MDTIEQVQTPATEPAPTPKRRGGTPGPLRQLIHERLATAATLGETIALADLVSLSGKPKAEVLVTLNNMKVAGVVESASRGSYKLIA